jgi:hypothetical protein
VKPGDVKKDEGKSDNGTAMTPEAITALITNGVAEAVGKFDSKITESVTAALAPVVGRIDKMEGTLQSVVVSGSDTGDAEKTNVQKVDSSNFFGSVNIDTAYQPGVRDRT